MMYAIVQPLELHQELGYLSWSAGRTVNIAEGSTVEITITVHNPTDQDKLYAIEEFWENTTVSKPMSYSGLVRPAGFVRWLPMWPGGADGAYVPARSSYSGKMVVAAPELDKYDYVLRLQVHPDYWGRPTDSKATGPFIDELRLYFTSQGGSSGGMDMTGMMSMITQLMPLMMMMNMMNSMKGMMNMFGGEEE